MNADPAAAGDVSTATDTTNSDAVTTTADAPVGSRADQLLKDMGVSDEVRQRVEPNSKDSQNAQEKTHKNEAENKNGDAENNGTGDRDRRRSREPGSPERPGDTGPTATDRNRAPQGQEEVDPEDELTPEERSSWDPRALKRIHKLTAQKSAERTARQTAEQRAEIAESELVRRSKPSATKTEPLADVTNETELEDAATQYEQLLEWAEINRDGLMDVTVGKKPDGEPVIRDFSREEMTQIRVEVGRALRHAIPARRVYLQDQKEHEKIARATLPEMFQKGTPENHAYNQALANIPELRRMPGYQQFIAWAQIGQARVRELLDEHDKTEGKVNGKVDPKVAPFLRKHTPIAPPVPSTTAGVATRRDKQSAQEEAVEEYAKAGADDNALVDLIKAARGAANHDENAALV